MIESDNSFNNLPLSVLKNIQGLELRITELCALKGLKYSDIESDAKLARGSVSKIAKGTKNPTTETLKKIAKSLDVTIYELFKPPKEYLFVVNPENGEWAGIIHKGSIKTE